LIIVIVYFECLITMFYKLVRPWFVVVFGKLSSKSLFAFYADLRSINGDS